MSIYFKEERTNKDQQKYRLKLEWDDPGKPGTKREENLSYMLHFETEVAELSSYYQIKQQIWT